jgi:hypothetical protein
MICYRPRLRTGKVRLRSTLLALVALSGLTGCLEPFQSTRSPAGALNNFFIHLQAGELDDARTYFAPGLVEPSASLDASIQQASNRLRKYQIEREKAVVEELQGGERRVTYPGRVRPLPPAGQPTPAPDEGWADTDIITARMVERGPGWRILEFELKCCSDP